MMMLMGLVPNLLSTKSTASTFEPPQGLCTLRQPRLIGIGLRDAETPQQRWGAPQGLCTLRQSRLSA